MAENENKIDVEQQEGMMIHSQYIKDMSLEIPFAPEIFGEMNQNKNPNVNIDISMKSRSVDKDVYEVALTAKMDANLGEKKLFILEVTYACVATVRVPEEHLEPILYIELPRLLFPYVRSIISNSLSTAGLPPLLISPIDFVALYNAKKAKEAEKASDKKSDK